MIFYESSIIRLMNCYWSKTEILWKYFMHRVTRNLSVLQSLQFVQNVAGKPFLGLRWVFSQHTCKGTKTVSDSGFQAADFGSQVLDSSQCQWSLDSEFQALVVFGIAQANFSPRERDQKIPGFWNPDFRTWSYMGQSSIEAAVAINMHVHISLTSNFVVFV